MTQPARPLPAPGASAPAAIGPAPGDVGDPFGDALDAPFAAGSTGAGTLDPVADPTPAEQPDPGATADAALGLWAVVFAGGIGSRFWPLSTPERPKALLALVGERPLIADTVERLAPLIPPDRVLVLTSADIAEALHAAIPDVPAANMLVEPRPMGTAASLAWGAQEVARRVGGATPVAAVHADLAVGFPDELRRLLAQAARLASGDGTPIVLLGAEPARPEPGFGYVVPGAALDVDEGAAELLAPKPLADEGDALPPLPGASRRSAARRVSRFVEKPAPLLADQLITGGAFWHTGMLVAQAGAVLDALAERTPELQPGLAALAGGKFDRFAGMIQNVSLERGLLERSPDLVVLPGACGWDDVGTWAALRRVRELDDTGNGVWGSAHLVDASSSVVHAEGGDTVVLYGVSGVLVVARPGLTFVTTLERAASLTPLLESLPESLRAAR